MSRPGPNELRKVLIEEIAGVTLRNGEDRLALHLGIKLARLAGLHPQSRAVNED